MCSKIASKSGVISLPATVRFAVAIPFFAEAKMKGESSCVSLAFKSMNNSKTSSSTSVGLASGRSILFTHTTTGRSNSNALRRTNLVCGIGPSNASTTRMTPFTIFSTRSTSPPKSAWPGVSMMLIFVSLYTTAVFLERIVIPRSLSISLESMTRSATS